MKAVLISIQPKWVEKIASGEKIIEVRKTRPRLDRPFKVYIYCTKAKEVVDIGKTFSWGKEVIGEFVCDWIDKVYQCNSGWVQEYGCMKRKEFFDYLGLPYNSHFDGKGAFVWHISNLVIYDKPKELSEFLIDCKNCGKKYVGDENCWQGCVNGYRRLTRPPQSWCYVEENER